jgi:hypothetical protein
MNEIPRFARNDSATLLYGGAENAAAVCIGHYGSASRRRIFRLSP